MRYELHASGEVYSNEDYEIILDIIETLPDEWILYRVCESKICKVEHDPEPILLKQPRQDRPPRPLIIFPLLPYDQAFKAVCLYEQKMPRVAIAKRLYCSLAQVTRSMAWYNKTNSPQEYESYDPTKKDLVEQK
jgi:hypothetical protein